MLTGLDDLGGIGSGEYKSFSYSLTNESTASAYVFLRIEESTAGLYEVVGNNGCRVYGTDNDGDRIAYNTSAGSLWQAYLENKD